MLQLHPNREICHSYVDCDFFRKKYLFFPEIPFTSEKTGSPSYDTIGKGCKERRILMMEMNNQVKK